MWTRRRFLHATAATGSAILVPALGGEGHARAANAPEPVLVFLMLRGAADGMSLVIPRGDDRYYATRPRVAVPRGEELVLDSFYGLHPSLAPLLPLYQRGGLALLHAVGSPDPTRSHFAAQDHLERAVLEGSKVKSGWLNRLLSAAGEGNAFAGVSLGVTPTTSLQGPLPTVAIPEIDDYDISGSLVEERRRALTTMYRHAENDALRNAALEAFASIDVLERFAPAARAAFPGTDLGRALRDAASLIRGGVGVRAVALDVQGWDHHSGAVKRTNSSAKQLAEALAAFYEDLGTFGDSTLTLVATEFGRTAAENGSGGTDHGHGAVMMALGGGVVGGRVLTRGGWPGLEPENLWQERDLAVTTDFRDVIAEVAWSHMKLRRLETILPEFDPDPSRFPGLFR